jgi:FkbM family methyltransferase
VLEGGKNSQNFLKKPFLWRQINWQMNLLDQLSKVEALAQAGKWSRLLPQPWRYLQAAVYGRWGYPLLKLPLVRRARTFFGASMQVSLPAGADIYLTGGKTHDSEIRLARWMIQNIQPGQQILDIGAHFGYFTLLAAHLASPKGEIVAVEAAADTFATLEANVGPFANIKPIRGAVCGHEGPLTFFQFPALYSEYNGLDVSMHQNAPWFKRFPPKAVPVEGITLDGLLAKTKLQPSFIKIDVEGAEDQVLSGAIHTLTTLQPVIAMEYLAGHQPGAGHQRACQILMQAGYQSYSINAAGYLDKQQDIPDYLQKNQLDSDNLIFLPAKSTLA